jgi:hypothetical protein
MPVRPMFNNRGVPVAKGKRHLKAVNPANATGERQRNPEEQKIPWKTIIATTIVTSMVSTAAVALARFLMDRAKERKELKILGFARDQQVQQAQLQQAQQAQQARPEQSAYTNPMLMQQANPGTTLPFQANPFSINNVQRPLSLPQAPHVMNPVVDDSVEPNWFHEFREDFDRRIQNIEVQVRTTERPSDRPTGERGKR